MERVGSLEEKRFHYQPEVPSLLKDLLNVHFTPLEKRKKPLDLVAKYFPKTSSSSSYRLTRGGSGSREPLRIGVLFSGGPAAGGHNVIWGIFEALQQIDRKSRLIGFLEGPSGLVENQFREISHAEIASIRNRGGFDLIGTGRLKIETREQMEGALRHCTHHQLDGLVVIGGDDSNTNAAYLAEYFLSEGCRTSVVGVPKTIDGDLQSEEIEIPFGFHSACKTYSEIIGNICRDAKSSKKYTHIIKLMGRSASHVALECALSTQPNLTLIGEERKGLRQIIQEIVALVQKRKGVGKEYGVILVPEGIVEFVPEMKELLQYPQLPLDPHGNVNVSQINTVELLISLVKKELPDFSPQEHFLGYEGRACFPTNFDANYAYALGLSAALAVREQLTGVICAISPLQKSPSAWEVRAVPLVGMMAIEMRKGKEKPVIQKALVDIEGKSFVYFSHRKKAWEIEDQYLYPGPIQFFGPSDLVESVPLILMGSICHSPSIQPNPPE